MMQTLVTSARATRTRARRVAAVVLAALMLPAALVAEPARDDPGSDDYTVAIDAPSGARVGTATTASLHLRPGAGWKLNMDYPFRVELTPGPGVDTAKTTLRKQDARTFAEHGVDVDVVFTARRAGAAELRGEIRFATCSSDSCVAHRKQFTVAVMAR